jgi:NAD(P)-dependent dehydrogenase (short-subunit alcohol dehydrogenase family)
MEFNQQVVFVTGAARGLGLAFARAARDRGAKVYAGVRHTEDFREPGIVPVQLDVRDDASVRRAAATCPDVTLVVNNAGTARLSKGGLDPDLSALTDELMDTNFHGLVRVSQAFAPALQRNGGGAIVNVLSDATWFGVTFLAAYAATKSAAWSYTNTLRVSLRGHGTRVVALHVGPMDTDLTREFDVPKSDPAQVAEETLDALVAGAEEVLADAGTRALRAGLGGPDAAFLRGGY